MEPSQLPTVDLEAPNGKRIVLEPVIRLERLPGLSRTGLAAVLTLSAIFLFTGLHPLHHTDLWGHVNFGRWIAENGRLPSADPFRWDTGAERFLNVPWLSQVLAHFCLEGLGLEGLVLAHAALVTLAAAGLMGAVRSRNVPAGWAVAAAPAACLLALPIVGAIRPQLFGILALTLVLWAIGRLPSSRRPLFWLPVVFVLWANLHGSFPVGIAALGCFALAQTWDSARAARRLLSAWRDKVVRRAWVALGVAVAASCVNPLGAKMLAAVAGFAAAGNLEGISEWRPMVIHSLSGILFFGSLLITAVLLRLSPRRVTTVEVLLILLFGLASLSAIRMLAWWALVWPWVAAPHAAATWRAYRRRGPSRADDRGGPLDPRVPAKRTCLAAVAVFLTLWWLPGGFGLFTGRSRPEASIVSTGTPRALADQARKLGITGRMFAPLDWADYLVFKSGARVQPLVTSNVHMIRPAVWQDFLRIRSAGDGWLDSADRHGLEYLAIDRGRNRRLAAVIGQHPRCVVLYEDPQGLLVRLSR
ncbi:MAG: hypothetical protein ACYTG0_06585 [Planctomycetota bacterium]|jgi:hypothetical protein